MRVLDMLREKRDEIVEGWTEAIFRTYPLDTVGFMRRQADQFANPIRHRTRDAVPKIVDALLEEGLDSEKIIGPLDDIIRIRAVQDFTPAKSVGIVFLLKSLLREKLAKQLDTPDTARELLQFESKIDSLALISFDIYTQCQKKIFSMRVDEIKNRQASLLRRAGLILEISAEEPDPTNP